MALIFLNSWRGFQGDYYAESRPEKKGAGFGGNNAYTLGLGPLYGMSVGIISNRIDKY